MSVAFRRESDEEHLEPKFELPVPPGPNLVTARGLAQIEAKVAEFEAAPSEETARELRYWRQRLATAQLQPEPSGDEAGFGSRVRFLLNGKERTITIVGDDEAEPDNGLIALSAPLAQAVLGAGIGDMLPFAGKDDAIEILDIVAE